MTTKIIRGGIERGGSEEIVQSLNRIKYCRAISDFFNVPVLGNETLGCKGMKQFGERGADDLLRTWLDQGHPVLAGRLPGRILVAETRRLSSVRRQALQRQHH